MLDLHLAFSAPVDNYPLTLSPKTRPRRLSIDVLREVSDQYGVSVETIKGPERFRRAVIARQAAMFELRRQTSLSYPQIGAVLGGRDHTTVIYGVRRHMERARA